MEPPAIFALLLLAAAGSFVVQSLAVYLRSFKREPYLIQSLAVSGCTLTAALWLAPRWGSAAVAFVYFAFSGVMGTVWAVAIFHSRRRSRLKSPEVTTMSLQFNAAPAAGAIGRPAMETEAQ